MLIAAHNCAERIVAALNSAARVVPVSNIYLVSDDSTDNTAELARDYGVQVVETFGRQGPAGAIESGIQAFRLLEEFPFVLLVDVDTRLEPHHLEHVLPIFDDDSVAAVDVLVDTDWRAYRRNPLAAVLTAHRARCYALAGRARTLPSVARTYPSSCLGKLELNPEGLAIADFDLTFQLHRGGLGRVVVCPDVLARTAAPTRLAGYRAQNRLWHPGFWQVVRRNGRRPFGAVAELLASSVLFAAAPLVVLLAIPRPLTAAAVAATILGADYLLTVAVAVARRQPRYLLPGLLFPVLRVLAAVRDGRVDLRAMALLAAICREHAITIAELGNPAHERGFPQLDRILVLSEVDGQPVTDATRAAPLLAWLRAQEPPYAPADVRVTPAGVRVSWRLPARLDQPPF